MRPMARLPNCPRAWSLVLLGVTASACVRHVYPQNHKIREYAEDTYAEPDAARTPGSLWSEGSHNLFEDARARRVGDILTVRVDEQSDATRLAGTQTDRQSSVDMGITSFLGAMQTLAAKFPSIDPNVLVGASTANAFNATGNTSRSGTLSAMVPVRIRKALPNGDFFIEGNKVLLLNEEESFLYLSGVVRPIDIAPDNSVASAVLADVELEYTGRGVVTENQSPGWLGRMLSYVWPF